MDKFRRLFEALQAIFGKGYVSKLFGNPSNVIKLPSQDARRFLEKELNILEANDNALKQGKKDLEDLIADPKQLEKLNDQELLTLTNNAERMAQRTGDVTPPPVTPQQNAEIIDMTSKEVVPPEGIASLKKSAGQQNPPGTLMGNLESRIKQLEASGEDLSKMKGQTLDDIMKNEGQAQKGMAQAQREGLVKATANDIMIEDMKSGKFPASKEMQQEILEGSPKALDHFRLHYGEDALEVLDSLSPDLQKLRSSREAADFAKKQFNFEAKMDRAPGSIGMDDAAKAEDEFGIVSLKDDIDDPEGFAVGGRVSYAYGSGLKLIKLLNKTKKSLKQSIKESADDIIPTGDPKLDADMAVDNMLENLGVDRDAVDGYDILDAYSEAYKTVTKPKIYGKYKFTGKESMNDLYELERSGKITRDDMNVYDPRYKEYLDAQIINKEELYTRKEWEKTPETIKNKTRALIDPDWKEANFGEDYNFEQVRGKELEGENINISNPETLDDFANFAKKNDPEGYKKIEDMVNDMNQKRELDNFDVTGRTKQANGTSSQGLDYLMGVERKGFGWGSEDSYGGGYSEAEANAANANTSQSSSTSSSTTGSDGENDSWGMPGSSKAMSDAVDAAGGYDPSDGISGYDAYNYMERLNQQRGISNAQLGGLNYMPSMMALDALRAINPYGEYSTTGPDANTVEGGNASNIPLTQNQFNTSLINDSSLYTPEQIDYRLFESSKNPFYSLRSNINSGGRIGYAEGSKPKGIKYLLGY